MFTPARIVLERIPRVPDENNKFITISRLSANWREPARPAWLSEAATYPLKATASLPEDPLNGSRIVVAKTKVMIQGGEAMRLARLLHLV
jgi:hypothetical protein